MTSDTDLQTVLTGLGPRIEAALRVALEDASDAACPPRLADALSYAVFPGGHRLRPQLALVAALSGPDSDPVTADAAASAVELLHSASLVHDDLPCFDDAGTRRGRAALHRVFGDALAILTGDALIVLAFQALCSASPSRLAPLVQALAAAGGPRGGIAAGQAWEAEPDPAIDAYHQAKTASLFAAAARMGAIAGGGPAATWGQLGELVGRAYQALDDLLDVTHRAAGKSGGKDEALGRPNVACEMGPHAARERLGGLLTDATTLAASLDSPLLAAWLDRFSRGASEQARRSVEWL